ncbi:hypothetical protein AAVH_20083 [Aphelenchoides avenae]|nr:hypothetical protein AAVH_20083 [Aphelenchus avenae]
MRRAQKQKVTYKLFTHEAALRLKKIPSVNVTNSFKVCGIGAIGGADDHLIHCLKEGNGIPNGLYELIKACEAAEAQELAAGFEIEAPYEDDTGRISDVEVIDDEPAAFDDESTGSEGENHNLRDDSDF